MGQKSGQHGTAVTHEKEVRRATRRQRKAEEKIRIVLEGLRGEYLIVEPCRKESIAQSLFYKLSKEFLQACTKRLAGDTERQASRSLNSEIVKSDIKIESFLNRSSNC